MRRLESIEHQPAIELGAYAQFQVYRPELGWEIVEKPSKGFELHHPDGTVTSPRKSVHYYATERRDDKGKLEWEDVEPFWNDSFFFLKAADFGRRLRLLRESGDANWRTELIDFADRYGAVSARKTETSSEHRGNLYSIESWYNEIAELDDIISLPKRDPNDWIHNWYIAENYIHYLPRERKVVFAVYAVIPVCLVMLAASCFRGDQLGRCQRCHNWTYKEASSTGPIPDYCSSSCRFAAYRERKEAARKLAGQGMSVEAIASTLDSTVDTVSGWIADSKPKRSPSRKRSRAKKKASIVDLPSVGRPEAEPTKESQAKKKKTSSSKTKRSKKS